MSSAYDVLLNSVVKQNELQATQKSELIAQKTLEKRQTIDPNYEVIDPDQYRVLDGDTVKNRTTGDVLRFKGPEGTSIDTFETNPDYYTSNPDRADYHRKSYAQLFGRDIDDVSNEDLVNAGLSQKQKLIENMESLRGQAIYRNDKDQYGRYLATFEDTTVAERIQPITAGYLAPSNYEQRLKALDAGTEFVGSSDRNNVRALTGDLATNIVTGGAKILNDLLQASSVISGAGNFEGVQEFFENNRGRIDKVKEALVSEEQLYREKADAREQEFLAPLYNAKKAQYMKKNPNSPEWKAALVAGSEQFFERVEYLLENPGRILDATAESLPYMIGVGVVGNMATKATLRGLQGKALKSLEGVKGLSAKDSAEYIAKFVSSKGAQRELASTAKRAGITVVGLSEGLSTSADVYASILRMTEEEASQSEDYKKLRNRGLDHQTAITKMANGAFTETLFSVTTLAAIAAAATGAGKFEGQLFTSLGKIRTEAGKSLLQKTTKGVGSVLGPATRELGEETIQSGGGELLSQIASKDATGEEVGPGVGTAAGEGAVVGFASGASFSSISTISRATGKAYNSAKDTKLSEARNRVQGTREGETSHGGSATPIQDRIKAMSPKERARESVAVLNEMFAQAEQGAKDKKSSGRFINEAREFYAEYQKDKSVLSFWYSAYVLVDKQKEFERKFGQYEDEYKQALSRDFKDLVARINNPKDSLTEEQVFNDPAMSSIMEQAQRELKFGENNEDAIELRAKDQKLDRFLSSSRAVYDSVQAAKDSAAENSTIASNKEEGVAIDDENEANLGYGVNEAGELGLEATAATIMESISTRDTKAFKARDAALSASINNKQNKYNALLELRKNIINSDKSQSAIRVIEGAVSAKYGVKVEYIPSSDTKLSGTAGFIKVLRDEIGAAQEVRRNLAKHAKAAGMKSRAITEAAAAEATAEANVEEKEEFISEPFGGGSEASSDKVKKSNSSLDEPAGEQTEPTPKKAGEVPKLGTLFSITWEINGEKLSPSAKIYKLTGVEKKTNTAENSSGLNSGDEYWTFSYINTKTGKEYKYHHSDADGNSISGDNAYFDLFKSKVAVADESKTSPKSESSLVPGDSEPVAEGKDNITIPAQSEGTGSQVEAEGVDVATEVTEDDSTEAPTAAVEDVSPQNDTQVALEEDTAPETASRASEADEQALIQATQELRNGNGLVPIIMGALKTSVDFVSDNVAKVLGPLVGEMSNSDNWSEHKLAEVKKQIGFVFKRLKLPTQINKGARNAKARVSNILTGVPNVLTLLSKSETRGQFFETARATEEEQGGMRTVLSFVKEFTETLGNTYLGVLNDIGNVNTPFKREGINTKDGRTPITNPIKEYLFQFLLDEQGNLNENIASIMGIEGGNWIASAGASTLNNRNNTINGYLGAQDDTPISNDDRAIFGNGTLQTTVAQQLGRKVIKEINFGLDNTEELAPEFEDVLATSIGNMVIAALVEMGKVQITEVDGSLVHGAKDNVKVNLIYTKPADKVISKVTGFNEDSGSNTTTPIYTEIESNGELRKAFNTAGRVLKDYFSVVDYRRGPFLDPEEISSDGTVSKKAGKIPKRQVVNISKSSKRGFSPVKTNINDLYRWGEGGQPFMEQIMGFVSDEVLNQTVHTGPEGFNGQDVGVLSLNNSIQRSMGHVIDWLDQNGDKAMYFAHNMISSHRIMIDSNTINPQADKLHRYLFGMKEWDVELQSTSLKPRGANKTRLDAFKVAVALALDIDIEGQTTEEIVREFDERIADDLYQDAINIMVLNSDELVKGQYTEEQMKTIGKAVAHAGEAVHSWAGLVAWSEFIKAGKEKKKKVTVSLPIEVDGKTNGYASLLMQFAPRTPEELKALEPYYNAVGIFFTVDVTDLSMGKYTNFAQFVKAGGLDNYNSVTAEAKSVSKLMGTDEEYPGFNNQDIYATKSEQEKLNKYRHTKDWDNYKELKDNIWNKNRLFQGSPGVAAVLRAGFVEFNRKFAKGPLTQVAYSAGMPAVRRGLRGAALDDFYTKLAKAGADSTDVDVVRQSIALVLTDAQGLIDGYRTNEAPSYGAIYEARLAALESYTTIESLIKVRREFVFNEKQKEDFEAAHDLVYGHSLQAALEPRLKIIKAVTEKMNDSVYLANLIFTADFKRRIEHKQTGGKVLTDKQRKKVLNEMIIQGVVPMVKTAMSESQLDGLETTSYGTVTLGEGLKARASFNKKIQLHEEGFDKHGRSFKPEPQSTSSSQLVGFNPDMNVGVAAIAMATHSSDGAVNGDLMGEFAILNLFDATLGNFETVGEVGTAANKGFYNTHKGWDMGAEFLASLDKLRPLLAENDHRLSESDKIDILGLFLEQRKAFSGASYEQTNIHEHYNEWLTDYRKVVNDNTKNRKTLHGTVSHVNQFAKIDTVYSVSGNDQGSARAEEVLPEEEATGGLLDANRKAIKQNVINIFRSGRNKQQKRKALNSWLDEQRPYVEDVIEVLYGILKKKGDVEQLRQILNTVRPMLTGIDPITGKQRSTSVYLGNPEKMGEDDGRYYGESGYIAINPNARDPYATILHEIIHAANQRQLEILGTQKDTTRFQALTEEARKWAVSHSKSKSIPERKTSMSILAHVSSKQEEGETVSEFKLRQHVGMISEYTAHLNSELTWKEGKFTFRFYSKGDITTAANALTASIQPVRGEQALYSSSEEIDPSLFEDIEGEKLTADTLVDTMEQLKKGETVSVEDQVLFTKITDNFLKRGLQSVDELIVKLATKPNGERNIGKVLVEGEESVIYIQATDRNKTTSNVDMSRQEVAIHEMLHPIFKYAINTDTKTQTSVVKLFDKTLVTLTSIYGKDTEWRAFLPRDKNGKILPPITSATVDEQQAKATFNHIFGNPAENLDYNDFLVMEGALPTSVEIQKAKEDLERFGGQGYHEFMAIGMSNPQFNRIINTIETAPEGKIFEGGIVQTFANIFERVLNLLRTNILKAPNGTVGKELETLAKQVITFNFKAKEDAKRRPDDGWITEKLDSLDRALIERLAVKTNARFSALVEEASKSGEELDEISKELGRTARLVAASKSAAGSILQTNFEEFRKSLDEAIVKKDHWAYELLTEVLPLLERNRGAIDILRRSDRIVDARRQELIEHGRSAIKDTFENYDGLSRFQREALGRVFIPTDLAALKRGDLGKKISIQDVLNILNDPNLVKTRIAALELDLARLAPTSYAVDFNNQSMGLADLMIIGEDYESMQMKNIDNIIDQRYLPKEYQKTLDNRQELYETLDQLTTLRALQLLDPGIVQTAASILTKEVNRGVETNGLDGTLEMLESFYQESLEKNFEGNTIHTRKGFIKEVLNEEISSIAVPYDTVNPDRTKRDMKKEGWTFVEILGRDTIDNNPVQMMLFTQNRGIATWSKSGMSLTAEKHSGTGLFESMLAGVNGMQDSRVTAARTHAMLARTRVDAFNEAIHRHNGRPKKKGTKLIPLFDNDGNIKDFTYEMTSEHKKVHLKRRDMLDEVLPGMLAGVEDKVNTKTINHEIVDYLYKDYTEDVPENNSRYVAIGKNVESPEGREMWDLLPMDTRIAVEQVWGGKQFYIRDDTVTMLLGFRKMSMAAGAAKSEVLAPLSPIIRVVEKIWQEVIQWERFKIAILNPAVVAGNIVSNYLLLLSQGIPNKYIIRESYEALRSLRKYKNDLRAKNELEFRVKGARTAGKPTRAMEAQLARLKGNLANSAVSELIEEGLFTSIVEEFGLDEQSARRQLSTKVLDKVGHITGSRTAIKVTQELMMVPGSELGTLALQATQYGDFVARYTKFKWDTKVKKMDRRTAIHESLDTFIYYNMPQNVVLQYMNDMGPLMFTKFFFRIQPIIMRTFRRNPVRATLALTAQQAFSSSNLLQENIANYSFLQGINNKFQNPIDKITSGSILEIPFFKWIPDVFWPD